MQTKTLTLSNGCVIDLAESGGKFLGLGAVRMGGTAIRDGRRPMFVEIRNPYGVELVNCTLAGIDETPERTRLTFKAERRDGGPMEWMLHEVRLRYNTTDWSRPPQPAEDTELVLELRPASRSVGGREFAGFSYQYHYRSASIPVYKVLDRGTWEPGGRSTGNELWLRNCFVSPIRCFESAEEFYSTEWFLPDCANPSVFQFIPFQTEFQGFTYTASDAGSLVTWSPEVSHIRTLIEKPRGAELIAHFHEHCGDLARELSTAPMEVLWSAGERGRVERMNEHEAWREFVYDTLHAAAGIRREYVTSYGQIEEWTDADLERYRTAALPKLLEAGMKTVYLANHFENNMNTWGVSNFCCNVDFKVAGSVGEDKLKAFCDDAKTGGANVEMWGNTAISTLTLMFDMRNGRGGRIEFLPREGSIMEALDVNRSFVRNPSNAIEADHYTPVFAVLNLRDPAVREYWHKCWNYAHDRIGLGGIFLDSSCNMSSDKFHYVQNARAHLAGATSDQVELLGNMRPAEEPAAEILSQYHAHLEIVGEMQKAGYVYCNEDGGVFGVHRHGPGIRMRMASLCLWSDCIAGFDAAAVRHAGGDPDDIFFRGLAYRMIWALHWNPERDVLSFHYGHVRDDGDIPRPDHIAIYKAFNAAHDVMRGARTVLPGEAGVVYRSGARRVLWAFEDLVLPLADGETVRDLLSGEAFIAAGELKAAKRRVYLIES
jgi:hypothetical protein